MGMPSRCVEVLHFRVETAPISETTASFGARWWTPVTFDHIRSCAGDGPVTSCDDAKTTMGALECESTCEKANSILSDPSPISH